jgi:hypothetical protein
MKVFSLLPTNQSWFQNDFVFCVITGYQMSNIANTRFNTEDSEILNNEEWWHLGGFPYIFTDYQVNTVSRT